MTAPALKIFLDFLQNLRMKYRDLMDHFDELYRAADKYDIKELKEVCEDNEINQENLLKFARLANLYENNEKKCKKNAYLWKLVTKKFQENMEQIIASEEFQELEKKDQSTAFQLLKFAVTGKIHNVRMT